MRPLHGETLTYLTGVGSSGWAGWLQRKRQLKGRKNHFCTTRSTTETPSDECSGGSWPLRALTGGPLDGFSSRKWNAMGERVW